MVDIETKQINNWREVGSIIVYRHNQFQYHSNIIITELEDCLINSISQAKLYNTMNIHNIELYSDDYIKELKKESTDKSIIIISNQVNTNKLNIASIKKKIESLVLLTGIPLLALFATKPNCFMKPHTGTWRFLNAYYRKYGSTSIIKASVISNEGGLIVEKTKKGETQKFVATSDIDRAFAWNINVSFQTIDEYLGTINKMEFQWDRKVIEPKTRELYIKKIKEIPKPNIFKELSRLESNKTDNYLILIMGAPRSGKTTIAKTIIKKWRGSEFGKYNAIKRLSTDKFTEKRRQNNFAKLLYNRISVIIDGNCHTDQLRTPYIRYAKKLDVPILCINIECGFEMAKVLNHSCVENAKKENVCLYKQRDYNIYKASACPPHIDENILFINYVPNINEIESVTQFRY